MKSSVVILKLSEYDATLLQKMIKEGWATEFEKKMYYNTYSLNEQDQADSVASYI